MKERLVPPPVPSHPADDVEAILESSDALRIEAILRHPIEDVVAGLKLFAERRVDVAEVETELGQLVLQGINGAANIVIGGSIKHLDLPKFVCMLMISPKLRQSER